MNPSRRKILKQLLTGLGCTVIPASYGEVLVNASVAPQFYSQSQFALVSRICALMIPATTTPGALETGVPGYLDHLFATWASAETRSREATFVDKLSARLSTANNPFTELSSAEAFKRLRQLDQQAFEHTSVPAEALFNTDYQTMKQRLTQAYAISEQGALDEYDWRAVPGQWLPSVPLETSST